MALQVPIERRGVTFNYFKITNSTFDAITNKTDIILSCFVSKELRDDGLGNAIEFLRFQFDGFLTLAESYVKLKESKIEQRVKTPAVTEGTYPNITIITEAVMEDYETNPFTNALDV